MTEKTPSKAAKAKSRTSLKSSREDEKVTLINGVVIRRRRLTGKQIAMINERLKDPTASNAEIVKRAGYNVRGEGNKATNTASQIYLENMRNHEIASILDSYVAKAEQGVIRIAEYAEDMGQTFSKEGAAYASVALAAYKDIQDRVKGKPTQRVEQQTTSVSVSIDLTDVAE